MAIPDFQSIVLPLLEVAADGQEHRVGEVVAALADRFKLTPEELAQLLPSGTQGIFSNRTQWATSCLRNAGLLETTGRGRLRITAEGQSVVAEKPTRVDIKSPMRYPAGCRRKKGCAHLSMMVDDWMQPAGTWEQQPMIDDLMI
jgi:restriction system protein